MDFLEPTGLRKLQEDTLNNKVEWERVCEDTYRLKVEGGYLYRWHNTQPVFIHSVSFIEKLRT